MLVLDVSALFLPLRPVHDDYESENGDLLIDSSYKCAFAVILFDRTTEGGGEREKKNSDMEFDCSWIRRRCSFVC